VHDVRGQHLREIADLPLADAVPAVLAALSPALADDAALVAAVRQRAWTCRIRADPRGTAASQSLDVSDQERHDRLAATGGRPGGR